MVPVSLRQPHEMGKLGNRFGLVILTLPVGTRDPVERLVIMKKRMDDIKHSPEALVAYAHSQHHGPHARSTSSASMIDFFATKTTAVMTNVPGPEGAALPGREPAEQPDVLGAGLRATSGWASAS